MPIDWFPVDAKFDGLMLSIAFPPKPVQVSTVMAVGDTSWVVVERELAHEYEYDGRLVWCDRFAGPDAVYLPDESSRIGFQRYPKVGAGNLPAAPPSADTVTSPSGN